MGSPKRPQVATAHAEGHHEPSASEPQGRTKGPGVAWVEGTKGGPGLDQQKWCSFWLPFKTDQKGGTVKYVEGGIVWV